jgi:hypothetical protein
MLEVLKQLVESIESDLKLKPITAQMLEALDAGRQAIADLEKQKPVAWRVSLHDEPELGFWFAEDFCEAGYLNEPLYTTPQPLQQEPVAWVNQANLSSAAISRNQGGQGDTHTWSEMPTAYHPIPLYTTPQPKNRVQFPVTLRKTWSGGAVQEWLDENVNKE